MKAIFAQSRKNLAPNFYKFLSSYVLPNHRSILRKHWKKMKFVKSKKKYVSICKWSRPITNVIQIWPKADCKDNLNEIITWRDQLAHVNYDNN